MQKNVKPILKALISITLVLTACVVMGAKLVLCPDCNKPVSSRAVMCPSCGCPGAAIKEMVEQAAATNAVKQVPLFPVARCTGSHKQGFAVAYTDSKENYLVMDARLIYGSTSLQITPVTTNSSVSYSSMQLASDAPLVRFRTQSTNLIFMAISKATEVADNEAYRLLSDGSVVKSVKTDPAKGGAVAMVDVCTNLIALTCSSLSSEFTAVLPDESSWTDIAPKRFREQTLLLYEAGEAAPLGPLPPERVKELMDVKWVNKFLKQEAEKIIEISKRGDKQ